MCTSLCTDSALAQEMCDAGSDHYCSVTCNRCSDSQNIIMLAGGFQQSPSKQWMLNPTFFALNGTLPACLASTKNDINDTSLNKIKMPSLFTNPSKNVIQSFFRNYYINFLDGNPVMCLGHANLDECYEYEVEP